MQKIGFSEALDELVAAEPKYHRDAYLFVRDALDFTTKKRKKSKEQTTRHVTGAELLDGVRELALNQFGPMVPTVFEFWGITDCHDIGRLVFNLIEIGVFGKTERDTIEEFREGYDFHEAFVAPFLPAQPRIGNLPLPDSHAEQSA
jgi:uncharacterized repeat protein (TIGR04138 family)